MQEVVDSIIQLKAAFEMNSLEIPTLYLSDATILRLSEYAWNMAGARYDSEDRGPVTQLYGVKIKPTTDDAGEK